MPGKIALRMYPDILSKIKMPEYIIAVTGSNGKTSTVEMINEVLQNADLTVAYNSEGSNQIDGVTTLVLSNCSLFGKFKKDVLLLESDERYAQYSFKYFAPTHYVITNLYRDQMTRNGNPEFVLQEIKKSIRSESTLIINSDDPIIASLENGENKVCHFGINNNEYTKIKNTFPYDDGYYCPKCKSELVYSHYQFGHVGNYKCLKCDFKRPNPEYYISYVNLDEGLLIINDDNVIKLAFKSIYNAYNILAAYAVTNLIGIDSSVICKTLNDYLIRNGRVKQFRLGNNKGTLLISKHENSVSYNQNIEYIINQNKDCTVFIMVDAISRKYFTSETSWLWDINFDALNSECVKKIIITGIYADDVACRLSYAGVDFSKVYMDKNINATIKYVKKNMEDYIYVLTCFSDEKKFTKKVEVL